MVPPRSRAGGYFSSEAVGCIGTEVSEAREGRRLAVTRPTVPLNIAARSFSLLLHAWCVFVRKSKLARLPRAPHPDDAVPPPDGSWAVSRGDAWGQSAASHSGLLRTRLRDSSALHRRRNASGKNDSVSEVREGPESPLKN